MKSEWWKDSIVYQIYPRSFQDSDGDGIGDLNGISMHLDYIRDLGADVIWLCPIYASPGVDNGYDISDYYSINPEFGTMDDFERLLQEAHKRHLKIIMDLVVNHTSDHHFWFQEARKSKDNPYRDYYIWQDSKPNNWQSWFGGPAWEYDEQAKAYYLHIFAKEQPDLNWRNPQLRNEVYQLMRFWLDKGVDGFRMDVINLLSKPDVFPGEDSTDLSPYCINGAHIHDYLQEMNEKVLSCYDIMTVGECPGITMEEAPKYVSPDRNELNMVFQFEHTGLTDGQYGKWTNKKTPLPALKAVFERWQKDFYNKAWNCLFWSNHDQPRAVSKFGNDMPEFRTISAKMLCMCLYLMQGTPYIYQGEELGMTNAGFYDLSRYKDLESINAYHNFVDTGVLDKRTMLDYLAFVSRDNARTPMQWDSSLFGGFSTEMPWISMSRNWRAVNAEREENDPDSVLNFYRKLLCYRKTSQVIRDGEFELLIPNDEKVFAYRRWTEKEMITVICNFSAGEVNNPVHQEQKESEILFSNYPTVEVKNKLKPYEGIVFYQMHKE